MNCCNDYGQCNQQHGCPARQTNINHDYPDDLNLWMPTISFLLGIALGCGLSFTYFGWIV